MPSTIVFLQDSFIKLRPVQSRQLNESEKEFVKAGSTYPLAAVSSVKERGHLKITLGKIGSKQVTVDGRNTVYVYEPHVQVKGSELLTGLNGIALIKKFEGLELRAYPDPGSGGDPYTIGYGHTGPDVYPGKVIDESQAELLLKLDLYRFEKAVNELVQVDLSQDQFDALVAFAFNVGSAALETSTLLRLLNNGDYSAAANQLLRWDKAAGRPMPGLTRRRKAERALFLGLDWTVF